MTAARQRRRLEKLKKIALARAMPPPVPTKPKRRWTPSDYFKSDTYLDKACLSQFDLKLDMGEYFKNLYGNRLEVNEDSCQMATNPKNIYKRAYGSIDEFPTNEHGLTILPKGFVYGVDIKTNIGHILQEMTPPLRSDPNCVPLGEILDKLPYDEGGSILPLGYTWGFSPMGIIPIYSEKSKKHKEVKPKILKSSSKSKIDREKKEG